MKKRIFDIIQIGNKQDVASRAFDILIVAVILINITLLFLESFSALAAYRPAMRVAELVTVLCFCVEYALRIWTADLLYPQLSWPRAVGRFIVSFDGIVDLLTILPFFFLSGFVAFRMLRVVRILHLFRLNAQYDSFHVIKMVLLEKKNQLLSSFFIIVVLMLASSLFLYSAEHEAQPEQFPNALSGIWWSVSTMLTIGYGDVYPITLLGKAMAVVLSFLGVGTVAIATGILSAGFVENYTQMQYSQEGELDIALQSIPIGVDSSWLGLTADEVAEQNHLVVLMARRGAATIVPNAEYRVELGDELVVYFR